MITIKEAEEILKHEYHIDNYLFMVKELILPDYVSDTHEVVFNNNIFESVTQLGYSSKCEVSVFEVLLKDGAQNRRVTITQEMFRILRGQGVSNAIVAFSNADKRNYRLSLLTSKYEFDGNKIVKVLSNPRRYSYSLGYGTKTKTAYDFLISKGKVHSLDELIGRFSIEIVNKQFYSEIASSFTKLIGGKRDGKTFEKELNIYSVTSQNKYAEFAVRLIGRIVFCWFLKEKKSENGIPLIPEKMLSAAAIAESSNYYHDVLEPLFFELLNTNQNRRKGKFAHEEIYKQIPYLNGGLFAPHPDDKYKYSPATQTGQYGSVTIPNEWFDHFFEVLSQYNFTVDENTSYDIELSIDPEMLGRIFENLLAEINPETGENAKKSTGSFYTPRDIVDYMVDNSIFEYLKSKTGIDNARLKALISYSKDDDDIAVFTKEEKKAIINALYTITVLDPACGSGAFPIGMLQKIVYMLQEIDSEANLWFDKATENVSFLIKKEFEKKFNAGSLDYIRKLSVIQNSIFGVDIQPIAVEIARLRCFLSLVIEEKVMDTEPNRGVNPLPSLDFKFIIANSLIVLEQGNQLSLFENQDHIEELKAVREEYFNADNERKAELREEFSDIQKRMLQTTIDQYTKLPSKRYELLYRWSPFKNEATDWFDPEWMFGVKDGFDIVIGNPPYLESRHSNFSDELKDKLQNQLQDIYGKNATLIPRGSDLLIYFYELSLRVMKKDGLNVFITQNSWLDTEYGFNFQQFLLSRTNILSIIDSDFKAFETANINTIITIFKGKLGCTEDIVFARSHTRMGDCKIALRYEAAGINDAVSIKRFPCDNALIRSNKWGFLFNSDPEFLDLMSYLNQKGKTEKELYWLKIGQGLNITKDYAYSKYMLPQDIRDEEVIPYLNVDECGYYVWNQSNTFLISNKPMNSSRISKLKQEGYTIYDEQKSKRNRPALILPRGIGAKHFCSINDNKGYSASCVDIYVDFEKEQEIRNLWLFMNTTLFWLIRETSGRKSLGGGMLKAEAVDLKAFPIYFNFKNQHKIIELIEVSKSQKADNAAKELESILHKQIDDLFYEELGIDESTQCYIKNRFIEKFNERTKKSTT